MTGGTRDWQCKRNQAPRTETAPKLPPVKATPPENIDTFLPTGRFAPWLWALLAMFCLRVLGQLLVALFQVEFLPPMEEWFSGVVAYPSLLASQLVIIAVYGTVCLQFSRGRGWFVRPGSRFGNGLLVFGGLYLSVMAIRYAVRMSLYPAERWTGGSIPIFFHWVLAVFLLIVGVYHRRFSRSLLTASRPLQIARILAGVFVCASVVLWVAYLVAPAALGHVLGFDPPQYAVRTHRSVSMSTSDGVELVAHVYRPRRADPTPTILVRIPYSKTFTNTLFADIVGRMWAEHGYTVVIQATRGRYESGGVYYPLAGERRDGTETLQWLDRQTWFDGRLGMWGASYFGYTQWTIADQTDPGPSALFIQVASSRFYDMFYHGGAFALESALYWTLRSRGAEDRPVSEDQMDRGYGAFPLIKTDDRAGVDVAFFNDWVLHAERDEYWQAIDGEDRAASLRAPALLMAGWFDPFLPAQLADFERIRADAAPEVAAGTRLIIGPWAHAFVPPLPGGYRPRSYRLESLAPSLPWFDRHLKRDPSTPVLPPVRLFVMGNNVWRDEQEWPLARTIYTPYYLGGNGGQRTLSLLPSKTAQNAKFLLDPSDPVRTRGGAMLGPRAGMREQDPDQRDDILSFVTEPLAVDMEVTGPVRSVIHVLTSAPSTDFTANLVDLYPDGRAYNISEGILRASYATDPNRGEPEPVPIEIAMWPTSIMIPKGHRVRLDISSSNYPRFDVNPNTGNSIAIEEKPMVAEQTVFWGGATPSQVILPIIPR